MTDKAQKILLGIAIVLIIISIITLLWNAVLISVFPQIGSINMFQALGLYILSNIMFKNNINKIGIGK